MGLPNVYRIGWHRGLAKYNEDLTEYNGLVAI